MGKLLNPQSSACGRGSSFERGEAVTRHSWWGPGGSACCGRTASRLLSPFRFITSANRVLLPLVREKTQVSFPTIKRFPREGLYPAEPSRGESLLLLVSTTFCSVSCVDCASACMQLWLTVGRRRMASFLPLSLRPGRKGNSWQRGQVSFVRGYLWVLPSSLKKSPSQVVVDCDLLPTGTAGNG